MSTLRGRLFAGVAAAVLVSVLVSLAVGEVLVRAAAHRSAENALARQAQLFAERASLGLPGRGRLLAVRAGGQRLVRLSLTQAQQQLPASAAQALAADGSAKGTASLQGAVRTFAAQAVGDGTVVVASRPATGFGGDFSPFFAAFLIAAAVGAALAAIIAFGLARAIARPVRRVADASRALAGGRSPTRIPAEGSGELRALAGAFNQMADELRQARESERSFLLSVSHELKTPLTSIRGYAEALEDGALAAAEAGPVIEREAGRLERLVADLLALARLEEHTFPVATGPIDLCEVAAEAVRRAERPARELGLEVHLQATGPAPAIGDADRVLQAVSNLVENAMRVTPAHGTVSVRVTPGRIEVSDDGPGIAAEDLPRAFERFYLHTRAGARDGDGPQVGSGLGLAIVKQLTEAMGGTAEVTSALGTGSTFAVKLPGA
ncbi:MAG: hypothetical protein DLM63_04720 [Solirubrobacterales bacterium]|nr:MAG: hypothetical protein DLM63_04720 [Solirubrobacterales bacterium]